MTQPSPQTQSAPKGALCSRDNVRSLSRFPRSRGLLKARSVRIPRSQRLLVRDHPAVRDLIPVDASERVAKQIGRECGAEIGREIILHPSLESLGDLKLPDLRHRHVVIRLRDALVNEA